jgi:hypothetical protein
VVPQLVQAGHFVSEQHTLSTQLPDAHGPAFWHCVPKPQLASSAQLPAAHTFCAQTPLAQMEPDVHGVPMGQFDVHGGGLVSWLVSG